MIIWIIIAFIVIVILLIYFSYEHLTSDEITLINFVEMLTNDQSANNAIVSKSVDISLSQVMAYTYPVGSIFISRQKYTLTDGKGPSNTPLGYGKWVMIDDTGVIGTANSSYTVNDATTNNTASLGNKQIQVNQIPPHKHQYQYNPGRKAKYNSNYEYSWTPRTDYTGADIYDKNNNKQTQVDFIPYGHYFYTYKKIDLGTVEQKPTTSVEQKPTTTETITE